MLRLEGDTLVLEHALRNTGTKPIETSVYNHNFFTLDRQTTGPDIVVRFPFAPQAARPIERPRRSPGPRDRFRCASSSRRRRCSPSSKDSAATAADYDFRLEHRATGAGVRITGDRPLTKLVFWSAREDGVPGAVHRRQRRAGRKTTWRITYDVLRSPSGGSAAPR